MKLLILGATGCLGSALVDVLADQEVVLGTQENFDITNFSQIKSDIYLVKPDLVINAAAYTDVTGAETETDQANLVNGQAVGNLAKICSELDIPLVHFSTDYVFSGQSVSGYDEASLPEPINAYGQSKLIGEKLIQESGCKYYLIRTAWLFGPRGLNFIEKIRAKAEINLELPVVNDQIGSPTYSYDLARVVRDLVLEKAAFGVYHITNSGVASWYDLAVLVKKLLGFEAMIKPISSQDFTDKVKRPLNSILLNTKLPKLRNWTEAVEDYLLHN